MLKEKSLLWSLNYSDSNTHSYIYGTMHVQNNAAFHQIDNLKSVIKEKPYFYTETNLDKLEEVQQQQSLFLLPEGKVLTDYISQAKFERWSTTVHKHFGAQLDYFVRTLPFITTQYLQSHYLSSDQTLPLDKYLWEYAKAEERLVDGIESVEFQANVLKQIPINEQVKMLKDFLANPNKYKRRLEALSAVYQDQDITKLYQMTSGSLGRLRSLMLKDLNARMARFIIDNNQKPSVYTFGAAHLGGRFGVLALLKRNGLEVRPN